MYLEISLQAICSNPYLSLFFKSSPHTFVLSYTHCSTFNIISWCFRIANKCTIIMLCRLFVSLSGVRMLISLETLYIGDASPFSQLQNSHSPVHPLCSVSFQVSVLFWVKRVLTLCFHQFQMFAVQKRVTILETIIKKFKKDKNENNKALQNQ